MHHTSNLLTVPPRSGKRIQDSEIHRTPSRASTVICDLTRCSTVASTVSTAEA